MPRSSLPITCHDCGTPEGALHTSGCDNDSLARIGRMPYIRWPLLCAYCGALWPEFFLVSDDEWKHYIQPDQRESVVCLPCYTHIKGVIDRAQEERVDQALLDQATREP